MCESVENVSIGERERKGERENKRKKEREREREEGESGRGRGRAFSFLFTFPSFSSRYASLHTCFWTHSDDVATLFPSSSLSRSLSHSLYSFNSHSHSHALSLSLSLLSPPMNTMFHNVSLPYLPLSLPLTLSISISLCLVYFKIKHMCILFPHKSFCLSLFLVLSPLALLPLFSYSHTHTHTLLHLFVSSISMFLIMNTFSVCKGFSHRQIRDKK